METVIPLIAALSSHQRTPVRWEFPEPEDGAIRHAVAAKTPKAANGSKALSRPS